MHFQGHELSIQDSGYIYNHDIGLIFPPTFFTAGGDLEIFKDRPCLCLSIFSNPFLSQKPWQIPVILKKREKNESFENMTFWTNHGSRLNRFCVTYVMLDRKYWFTVVLAPVPICFAKLFFAQYKRTSTKKLHSSYLIIVLQ